MPNFSNNRRPNMWWLILLFAPFVAAPWVPFFNRVNPEAWGIPFFPWYQFLWVVIGAVVTTLVYFKAMPPLQPIRRKRREQHRE